MPTTCINDKGWGKSYVNASGGVFCRHFYNQGEDLVMQKIQDSRCIISSTCMSQGLLVHISDKGYCCRRRRNIWNTLLAPLTVLSCKHSRQSWWLQVFSKKSCNILAKNHRPAGCCHARGPGPWFVFFSAMLQHPLRPSRIKIALKDFDDILSFDLCWAFYIIRQHNWLYFLFIFYSQILHIKKVGSKITLHCMYVLHNFYMPTCMAGSSMSAGEGTNLWGGL